MRVFIVLLAIVMLVMASPSYALLSKGCPASPATAVGIIMNSIATLYNVLPIKIGAIPVLPSPGLYDDKLGYPLPICVCLLPIPRFGITLSYWNPIEVYETVKVPFCFPILGADLPVDSIVKGLIAGSDNEGDKSVTKGANKLKFAQVHVGLFPVWRMLQLFTDTACMDVSGSTGDSLDITIITEVDPFWQNDLLTAIFHHPETILFANPIAQLACIPDAVASSLPKKGRPINTLFWCAGTLGSVYPVTGHADNRQGIVAANLLLANRVLYGVDAEGLLVTSDKSTVFGSCQAHPSAFWKKSQFSWQELFPVVQAKRMQIGRAVVTWGAGKNPPVPGKCDHFDWLLWRKKSCCVF